MLQRIHLSLVSFISICLLVGCGGGGGEASPTDSGTSAAPPPNNSPTTSWPGRAWFTMGEVLYSRSFQDGKAKIVDHSLLPALDDIVASHVVSRSGNSYLVYAADGHVTRTDFAVRSSADASTKAGFSSPLLTDIAKPSDDMRYIAWIWAEDYYSKVQHKVGLKVVEVRPDLPEGARTVANVVPLSPGSNSDFVAGIDWAPNGVLVYTMASGEIWTFSTVGNVSRKIGALPSKYGAFNVLVSQIRVSPGGDQLLGTMRADQDHVEIWTSNIDGTGVIQRTAVGMVINAFDWSPDGRFIYGADCRLATGTSGNHLDQIGVGVYKWIFPSNMEMLSLSDAQEKYSVIKSYSLTTDVLPCASTWTM